MYTNTILTPKFVSLYKPSELSQWSNHDASTINIVTGIYL